MNYYAHIAKFGKQRKTSGDVLNT